MNALLEFLCNYWFMIVVAIAVLAGAGIIVYDLVRMPKNEQLSKIQEWLLYAVVEAEHELGSGTGQIKLRLVYDMFIGKFPSVAKILTFEGFSGLVDTALVKMENIIKSNKQLAEYVGRTDKEKKDGDSVNVE